MCPFNPFKSGCPYESLLSKDDSESIESSGTYSYYILKRKDIFEVESWTFNHSFPFFYNILVTENFSVVEGRRRRSWQVLE